MRQIVFVRSSEIVSRAVALNLPHLYDCIFWHVSSYHNDFIYSSIRFLNLGCLSVKYSRSGEGRVSR
jgi:hypothetical protein